MTSPIVGSSPPEAYDDQTPVNPKKPPQHFATKRRDDETLPLQPRQHTPSDNADAGLRLNARLGPGKIDAPESQSSGDSDRLEFVDMNFGSKNWINAEQFRTDEFQPAIQALRNTSIEPGLTMLPNLQSSPIPVTLDDGRRGTVSGHFKKDEFDRPELLRLVFKESGTSSTDGGIEIETPAGEKERQAKRFKERYGATAHPPLVVAAPKAAIQVEISAKVEKRRGKILKLLPKDYKGAAQSAIDAKFGHTQQTLQEIVGKLLPQNEIENLEQQLQKIEKQPQKKRTTPEEQRVRTLLWDSQKASRILAALLPGETPQAGKLLEGDTLRIASDAAHLIILSHLETRLKDVSQEKRRGVISSWEGDRVRAILGDAVDGEIAVGTKIRSGSTFGRSFQATYAEHGLMKTFAKTPKILLKNATGSLGKPPKMTEGTVLRGTRPGQTVEDVEESEAPDAADENI